MNSGYLGVELRDREVEVIPDEISQGVSNLK